eukprot:GGOE01018063.1.p1 GENE.GGOE01018063.1~~GGOE01018063.1.p1  ORF type:complete len:782 (-),score=227.67 GGOE01018063.1:690-3035(-)
MLRSTSWRAVANALRPHVIDLRSDTVTLPSLGQRLAMAGAEVGDDVRGEDPTVLALQDRVARLLGKPAALFVPSGTMGNVVSIAAHVQRGEAVVVGDLSHVCRWEACGASTLLGAPLMPLVNAEDGTFDLATVERIAEDGEDPHSAPLGLVVLENTHNACGGRALRPAFVKAVAALCRRQGVRLHVDGARLFNAATALNCPASQLVEDVDSVQVCLSKGIGAPVGSVVVGDAAFIQRAARARKMLGGGMRQAGVLAAAALQALDETLPQLTRDHQNAHTLAEGLAGIPGIVIDKKAVETNIVHFGLAADAPVDTAQFLQRLGESGVLVDRSYSRVGGEMRALLNCNVTTADVHEVLGRVESALTACQRGMAKASVPAPIPSEGKPKEDPTTTPAAIEWDAARLHITWRDGHRSVFLHVWLRDHCLNSMHTKTLQRNIDSLAIPPTTRPAAVTCSGDRLTIDWDVPIALFGTSGASVGQSVFPTAYLRDHCYAARARQEREAARPKLVLWEDDPNGTIPRLEHRRLLEDPDGFTREMLVALQQTGAVVVTGTPPTSEGLDSVGMRIGHWLSTIWGPNVWTLTNKAEKDPEGYIPDTAYTNLQLGPHIDCCYMQAVPALQVFLCVQPSVSGGATWLLDGFSVAEELRRNHPRAFAFFRSIELPFHCITDTYHVQASHPVIETDEWGNVTAFMYNNDDRAPLVNLPEAVVEEFYEHLPNFLELLRSPKLSREVLLRSGDCLFVNNLRVLHGRRSFVGERELIGGYLSRDQLHSACRRNGVPILF